jgi:CheY-like chemotaxis protein
MGVLLSIADGQAAKSSSGDLDQLKSVFLATLSHEIRTPLSGILGMADLLLETHLDDEQREYVAATKLCAENLFQLLNASLQYSAISTGQVRMEPTEFALRELVDSALHQTRGQAAAKGLRVSFTLGENVPETIVGDAIKIQEILLPLLDNAVKFTRHGSIDVRADIENTPAPALTISVRDSGIGIAPEDTERIFASFQQLDSGQSRAYPGIGLGLALAKKLASLMNGEIHVDSAVGTGSTFTVRVPVGLPAAQPQEEVVPPGTRMPLILIVEDNPTGMMVLRHALKRHPVRVESAKDGKSAVAAASMCQFDLILMDLQMPDMNGMEATAAIRKLSSYQNVPILALTADISDYTRRECLECGMQDFLGKPIDSAALWASIRRHLNLDQQTLSHP